MTLDPVVLFFLLGLFAALARSELKLPPALYETLSVFLLLAIGLKGGVALAKTGSPQVLLQVLLVILLGTLLTLLAFGILRWRLNRADAAATAAHYGSVSVVTFAVAASFLARQGIEAEPQLTLFLAVMEMPALVVGVLLARLGDGQQLRWGQLAHEVFLGKSMVLLLGGLVIGWLAGPTGIVSLSPLYVDLFKPVLSLFLLEMGLLTAAKLGGLRRQGGFVVLFGLLVPLGFACIGLGSAYAMGLSAGGALLLATLCASSSYIAAPAAMRIAVPEANPALSLAASLGVTFPFNLLFGIPLYWMLTQWLYA
ncbi:MULTISPECIES: sodium-dependent bicarbonate transport family permease [Vogesella]|uniref:sodium-dependent bicarbonate transport family permease n=1 Tax=Vogesella TaxID=57739 RepID=UPI0021087F25|nr:MULTISPECIES: sodium-dependent bicarbonate transport family permease [Vogesella]MCQ4144051.1 sodium-dependent bicarbonate transport family permease [Vogesella sp. AC12]MDC7706446.1 sodium-dependent bicarbonate transport family permease [Vogesella indigofera]